MQYGPPPPPYGSPYGAPGAYPPPGYPSAGYPGGYVDPQTQELARKDPQTAFLVELLCTGLLNLPGIGQIMVGDVGLGIALLIGYPIVVIGFWSVLILVTCGIGGVLAFAQLPINFLVGWALANRAKQKILNARRMCGMPVF